MASENNRRLARNTFMLYMRMAVTMVVGILVTRRLLEVVGVVDYGLINVIGGVVCMFAFLSTTLTTAALRFFNFEMGRRDFVKLKQTVNLMQLIYAVLVVILLVIAETLGLWVLETKLVIPVERQDASFWFYQCTVACFLMGAFTIPCQSLVIAHENMKMYAWVNIMEAAVRLIGVYLLYYFPWDSLAAYGLLLVFISVFNTSIYHVFCWIRYPESHWGFYWNRPRFVEIISFSIWNLFGSMAHLFNNILVNVLLNNFFGAVVNAARAVAFQVSAGLAGFTSNFLMAVDPQIVKYYAAEDFSQSYTLTTRACKLGFLLSLFFILPSFFEMDFLLSVWLTEVPQYTVLFTRLVLIQVLVDVLSYPLNMLAQASGRIALYQFVVGGVMWLTFPVSYLVLRKGGAPFSVFFVGIGISIICLWLRLILVRRCANYPVRQFLAGALFPCLLTVTIASAIPLGVLSLLTVGPWIQFLIIGTVSVFSVILAALLFALSKNERIYMLTVIKSRLRIAR